MPRHLELIGEINRRFLDEVAHHWPGDGDRVMRLSIFEEGEPKRIRMAHLALVGSHTVNGVAALHSKLLQRDLFADFHALWPTKVRNITNGVTQRRWLLQANPAMARLITEAMGEGWITELRHFLDGANIEIRDAVGAEQIFIFGLDEAGAARNLRCRSRAQTRGRPDRIRRTHRRRS